MDCSIKAGTSDTIQFYFKSFTTAAAQEAQLTFSFTRFQNPYSNVRIKSNIRWFSDKECTRNQSQMDGTDLTFLASEMLQTATTVGSTSN